jgi:hypothetical protein
MIISSNYDGITVRHFMITLTFDFFFNGCEMMRDTLQAATFSGRLARERDRDLQAAN